MINAILYGILMFCCFVAIVTGRRTLIYAAALLMPAIQVMPSLAGPPTSAPNLIVLGLLAGALFHSRRRNRKGPGEGVGSAASGTMATGAVPRSPSGGATAGRAPTGPKPWAASAPTPGGATAVPSTVPSIMSTTLAPAPRAIPQPPARAVPSFVRGAGSGAGTDAFPGSSAVAAGAAARTGTA